jgi:hypothetical protein
MSKATLALLEESLKELKAGLRPKPR